MALETNGQWRLAVLEPWPEIRMDFETLLGLAAAFLFFIGCGGACALADSGCRNRKCQSHSGFCQATDNGRHLRYGCNNLAEKFAEPGY